MKDSMRIIYLTAGAAGMYCGSCLRDNALVAALTRMGCDVQLVPLYTPIRTDETDVSSKRLFFGGINVFLQEKSGLFRKLPLFLDALLNQPRLVKLVASGRVETDARLLGEMTLSMLDGESGRQGKEVHRLLNWLRAEGRPNLINLTNILIAGCVPALKRELQVPVLVTLQGEDLFLSQLEEPYKFQALHRIRALAEQVDGFVTFSRFYADLMSELLHIPERKIHVVPLGIAQEDFQTVQASSRQETFTVGYLARVCPEKGFHLLVDAFRHLRRMEGADSVQLLAAGWLSPKDEAFLAEQRSRLAEDGIENSFKYLGVVDRQKKLDFFEQIDVLSVPSVYREPKGLYVLEALASGVPVVQPAHGIFPELLEASGAGLLVPPHDPVKLAEGLRELWQDPERCRSMGELGRHSAQERFTSRHMAERTLEVYRRYLAS